jgi:4-hydroxybenzoate polyprenyltransferase
MTVTETVPDSERRGLIGALPGPVRPYASLMRLDRPIGSWLLFWPGAWAIALAGMGPDGVRLILLFALGAFVMRSAGCVYNDIVDRDLDARVERTRLRPLARGRVSLKGAWALLIGLSLVGLLVLLQLRPVAQIVAREPGAGGGLSLYEADHLVAAGLARLGFCLGRLGGLAGGDR